MFNSTRIKLTVWYIAIVSIVSFSFSAIIYTDVTDELTRGFQTAEFKVLNPRAMFIPRYAALGILRDNLKEAKRMVLIKLIRVNGIIIVAAGIAAYVLAGKTLEPLQDAVEKQKRFTTDVSHELKTPLTAIRTELEVALREKKLTLKEAKSLLQSNLEEVVSLQKLAENLMLLNRYSQAHNGLHFTKLNSREVIEGAIKKLKPLAKGKKIKIAIKLADTNIKTDAQSLGELVVILLDNAIKYSPTGSEVVISSEVAKNNLILKVTDQGIGIAKKDQKHLFDRFYRADTSRNKTKAGGYGLGLAIAKEIVEKHKGSISVKSIVEKGSTFTVTLPLS